MLALCLLLLVTGCGDNDDGAGVPIPGTTTPLVSAGDSDGDGRTDQEEVAGYEILVDDIGFGPGAVSELLTRRRVTSDPFSTDTDADGLDDMIEFSIRTDPRSRDTDGDDLSDRDEWLRWRTSPVSVDSDGDATGPDPAAPLPPNAALFDGNEILVLKTSPSLADTDGDNATDFEEADDPLRSPLIADLPRVDINFEGDVTIQLFVEYAEMVGTEMTYGEEFSTTDTTTRSRSDMTSTAVTTAADEGGAGLFEDLISGVTDGGLTGAAEAVAGPLIEFTRGATCDFLDDGMVDLGPLSFDINDPDFVGDQADQVGEVFDTFNYLSDEVLGTCAEATPETTMTTATTLTEESSQSATESYSRFLTDSRSMTETTSRGEVRYGARIENSGLIAYTLRDLFITMMQWEQSPGPNAGTANQIGNGAFRTLATLQPVVDQITLGPGDESPVIEFQAVDVNPSIIKQFLQRPRAVFYAPAGFELENADGINYEFLLEQTLGRTATVTIDYGDGLLETYQVATNVQRYSATDEAANPAHV
ncbi:MAG: hypothetical protein ACYTG6_06390, partial [Planctomycetota bacterium]